VSAIQLPLSMIIYDFHRSEDLAFDSKGYLFFVFDLLFLGFILKVDLLNIESPTKGISPGIQPI
jgi:hypothetical protein